MIKKPSYETVPLYVVKTRTVGALGNRQSLPCNVKFLQRESGSEENYPSSPASLLFQNTCPISILVSKTSRLYNVISSKHSIISYGKNKRLNEGWEGVRPLSSESHSYSSMSCFCLFGWFQSVASKYQDSSQLKN
jgi:hypothetical protein